MIDNFKRQEWFTSSTGEGLSLTIQGLGLAGLISSLALISRLLGFDIAENELTEIVGGSLLIVSTGMTITGLLRKIYFRFKPLIFS